MSSDDDFPNDDFFPDIDNLFRNLNMGDNQDAAAANVGRYKFLSSSFQILLEFLVLLFGVYAIGRKDLLHADEKRLTCCLSIDYRFLIVKSEVSDMHVGTIMESNDATFFEDIFSMKDMSGSSNQEMPSSSSRELVTIPEPTIAIEHYDNHVEDDNEAPKMSKRQRTAKSFGHDFIVYLVDDTPTSSSETYASQDADYWKEAIRSEMDSILANETWEVTDRPYGCKPVGCKWVFKKKLRPDGTNENYKAQLVTKGYTKKEGHRNPASRRPVRVRGNQVFGERLRVTTGNTTSSDDDFPNDGFFPDIDNLNMGDNQDASANIAAVAAAAANAGRSEKNASVSGLSR
ncbi:hypothetical protein QYE76_053942 [Lolium multiflorum]|uniref:Reverse transcriptase Ty1/copia-type domain-containing protein n=1 Tax=Lolium multiflorum TaxID=4521 RepID=A0AAD8WMG1_LOLMU|nr:hypothetical protein QYE76_053942 [Lolium multiflorum]